MRHASITNIHVHGKLIYSNTVLFKNKNTTRDFRNVPYKIQIDAEKMIQSAINNSTIQQVDKIGYNY